MLLIRLIGWLLVVSGGSSLLLALSGFWDHDGWQIWWRSPQFIIAASMAVALFGAVLVIEGTPKNENKN